MARNKELDFENTAFELPVGPSQKLSQKQSLRHLSELNRKTQCHKFEDGLHIVDITQQDILN